MRSKTTARPLALAKSFDLILAPTNFPLSPKNPEKSGETGRTGRTGQTGQTGETGETGRTGRRQQPPAALARSFDLILVPTNYPLSHLDPDAPIKTTSNHLYVRKLLVLCGAGGISD